jgi:hypothetical protein
MNRLDWPSKRNRASSAAFVAFVAGGAAFCACGGGDDSTTSPPVIDAGSDGSLPDAAHDGGEASTAGDGEAGPDASSAPPCDRLPGTIVYIESGDTQEALLKRIGRELRDTADVTIVFELTGSCTLTPNLYNASPIAAGQAMLYVPSTAENPNWTTAQAESTCSITAPTPPDLGISALYPASCQLGGPPAGSGIGLTNGPIQAYTFVVPPGVFASDGMAITAEEAHAAFGASKGQGLVSYQSIPEWNDPQQMFFRPTTKSTLVSTAFNIQLTAAVMAQGAVQEPASGDVLAAVAAATSPNAIGILGDEVYDTQGRGKVNVLAFRAFGQNHAYFPDSTATAFDKQNIRDGHYAMWSPTVYITKVDSTGEPTNPAVRYIVDTVTGNPGAAPPDGGARIDGLSDVAHVGLTPSCAMQVTRAIAQDGAPISAAPAPPTCTCYFLSQIPSATGTPADCVPCGVTDAACGAGLTCVRGFCEGQGAGAPAAVDVDGAACDTVGANACTNATPIDKAGVVVADGGM